MTRTLPITAAALASQDAEGRVWLVLPGMCSLCIEGGNDHESYGVGPCTPNLPPLEFALACAPCRCVGSRIARFATSVDEYISAPPCPDCRIELEITDGFAFPVVVGHAYAVGQPLPIAWGVCDLSVPFVGVWRPPYPPTVLFLDPDEDGTPIDLAHYGPPESLVGKWALRLEVVGS